MRRDVCAVDFTTNSLQILVAKKSGAADGTEALLPSEAMQDGKILQPAALQLFITRLLKDLGLRLPEIRVALSDSACVTRYLDYPPMSDRDLERSLRFEAVRELPMSPRSAYLGWQVLDRQASSQSVLLVGAWRDVVEDGLQALDGLGTVSVVEPRAMALARAVGIADAVLLDGTGDRLQIAVVEARRVSYTNTALLTDGAVESLDRVLHVIASLLPKARDRRLPLPRRLILLGKLHGRHDIAAALEEMGGGQRFEPLVDWKPADPFGRFTASSQVANIGLLVRN